MSKQIYNSNKYHYVYKITNLLNLHFYIGVHNTNNLEDGYMGSGKLLHYAYKKDGIENFKKEILKYFDTADEAFTYEAELVTKELIKDKNCYNIHTGGYGGDSFTGKVVVFDPIQNKNILVDKDDKRYLSGELKSIYVGKTIVKDSNGKKFLIDITDERYINKDVLPLAKGIKLSDEHKQNVSIAMQQYKQQNPEKFRNDRAKGHMNKTTWIYKFNEDDLIYESLNINITLLNEYLQNGWKKGRKLNMIWINNGIESKMIKESQLDEYLQNGWIKGVDKIKKSKSCNNGCKNPNYGKHEKQIYRQLENGLYENKQVDINVLSEYLQNGWKLGRKRNK